MRYCEWKAKIKRIDKNDYIAFVLRYSLFHKEIKMYDKKLLSS